MGEGPGTYKSISTPASTVTLNDFVKVCPTVHSSNASDVHDSPSATTMGDQEVVSLVTVLITHSL